MCINNGCLFFGITCKMEKECFSSKSYCELIITSQEINPQTISEQLNITPSRSYVKGEAFSSKHSGTQGKRFQHLWALQSQVVLSEEESISGHIQFFRNTLKLKIPVLKLFKKSNQFEITFRIWIESENDEISTELLSPDVSFLNKISDSIIFSLFADISSVTEP